jgi:cell division septum initiation protein DivIVA
MHVSINGVNGHGHPEHGDMARGGNMRALGDNVPTERSFDIVFRGYARRDVDQYVLHLENQLAALVGERQENQAQVRNLSTQLNQVQAELIELRRRPGLGDKATFHHLGPRIEHMLSESEAQAEEIRAQAIAEMAKDRSRTAELLAEAREKKARALQDLDDALSQRRAEESREAAKRMEAASAKVTEAQEYAQRLQLEADSVLAAAVREAQRVTQAAQVDADRIRGDTADMLHAARVKSEEEAATLAAAAELYAQQTRAGAEQHAQETRAAAEQHAQQTRAAAEQSATQLRLQAEQHAAQVRIGAEQHAARLLSAMRIEEPPRAADAPDPQPSTEDTQRAVDPAESGRPTQPRHKPRHANAKTFLGMAGPGADEGGPAETDSTDPTPGARPDAA